MFVRIGIDSAASTDGFLVRKSGLFTLIYQEWGHTAHCPVEFGGGETDIIVDLVEIRWQPPHDQEKISEIDKERIRKNIGESLKFLNLKADLVVKLPSTEEQEIFFEKLRRSGAKVVRFEDLKLKFPKKE